ncbi:hypothetical protein RXV86_09175 [Alisedimentitalea sp. MJ-SS2]|uniref:hypothetical protein n=1 Tax=Aliisedimentitalea sp. MJ-SS2 TaxID=3049795 RepID=UPI0029065F9F|nr:hypothetical protein [Alisedimentitalea sp. MJ-SS2]MDU8927554.1 hypothetical protein [Alisedimentitalea sp. MJ-SS2]
MKRLVCLVFAVALAACNTPSPGFRGVEPVRITIGQSTFDVRVDGNRAEAIRLNREWAPRLEAVAPRAVAAIEKVSGCSVAKLGGDQALIEARLKCGKGAEPIEVLPGKVEYDCDIDDTYVNRGLGEKVTEMTCTRRRY